MQTLDIIIKARDLICYTEDWAQQALAETESGRTCSPDAPEAVRFCALGAIIKVAINDEEADRAIHQLAVTIGCDKSTCSLGVEKWNDTHEHADVLDTFEETIDRLRKERV